jgi:HK97 family phage portal protein
MARFLARLTDTARSAATLVGAVAKGWAEGSWRGPFFGRGELSGAMFELGYIEDGFQRNLSVAQSDARHVPMVYAAVMANAKAASTCWAKHRREKTKGSLKYEDVRTSPAARIFRDANPYETWPVFLLNMIATMGFDGQAYALAVRDDRYAVTQLHRMPRGSMTPIISPEDGSIYYAVGVNPFLPDLSQVSYVVPARDVWHLRQHCPRNPLLGESPCNAAALAMGTNVALSRSQMVFFARMSRPSGVLVSDQQLNLDQMTRLRENWNAQSALLAQGGVPILGNGVKWQPMTITSEDSQLIEAQRMSGEDIARVYGVPLPVVGELSHATLNNVEQLVSLWLSTGLSSLLELVERDLNRLFGFDGYGEYVDLDTKALLRTDFAARVDALCKGIQGALFKPNEARAFEDLPPVDGGDEVYAQAQMQPLGTPLPAPAEPDPDEPDEPDADPGGDDAGSDAEGAQRANAESAAQSRALAEKAIARAMSAGYGAQLLEDEA